MSGIEISSGLSENRLFKPSAEFTKKARIKADDLAALHKHAADDYEGFWAEQARTLLDWKTPFTQTLDASQAPHYKWFSDGTMNVSYNCIDRHLEKNADKTAIIFEGEVWRYPAHHIPATARRCMPVCQRIKRPGCK